MSGALYVNGDKALLIEPAYDYESPREWDNLGTMLTWGHRYSSPDENPYSTPEAFIQDMLYEHFETGELLDMIRSGKIDFLRLVESTRNGEPTVELQSQVKDSRWERDDWWYKEDFEECGEDAIVESIAGLPYAPSFLQDRMAILPVYRFEHSDVAYSTSSFGDPWDSGQVGFAYADVDKLRETYGNDVPLGECIEMAKGVIDEEVALYSAYANGDVYEAVSFTGAELQCANDVITDFWTDDKTFEAMASDMASHLGLGSDFLQGAEVHEVDDLLSAESLLAELVEEREAADMEHTPLKKRCCEAQLASNLHTNEIMDVPNNDISTNAR